MTHHWLSTTYATAAVITDSAAANRRIIVDSAPIYRKLIGQSLDDVVRRLWLCNQLLGCKLLPEPEPVQGALFELPTETQAVTAYAD